ncbi:MAG TPA: F0F1 ATP synthase subunit delta [Candidatus Binataceae bacterium]|jgi:F-type H+-transporting ATPase subunit b|nr:F0F1 ATP synthase subunit delta [Candidatus Binataceae bacterium]
MNFSWWTFTLQAANFLVLVWLLQHFLFKPIKAIVARRKEEIARALTDAAAQKQDAERLKQELEAKQAQLDAERQKIIEEERAQVAAERQKIIEQARKEAETIREQTLKRLDEERVAAGDELFERTVTLATNLAERFLRELAMPSMEQPFLARVTDYLDKLPGQERARLVLNPGAGSLSVTTAHVLEPQEQARWSEQLAKRLGGNSDVTFSADPALIAGAVITLPHAVLRFNWRDSLAAALHELHGDEHSR